MVPSVEEEQEIKMGPIEDLPKMEVLIEEIGISDGAPWEDR